MPSGYSGRATWEKLGIKSEHSALIVGAEPEYEKLIEVPFSIPQGTAPYDFVHLFADKQSVLEKALNAAISKLATKGMLWISWPKKASKVPTDLDDSVVRQMGINAGLVDIKVCAVNEKWSGLKFVIPVKDRK